MEEKGTPSTGIRCMMNKTGESMAHPGKSRKISMAGVWDVYPA